MGFFKLTPFLIGLGFGVFLALRFFIFEKEQYKRRVLVYKIIIVLFCPTLGLLGALI